jgi:predicted NACHT family NTPase
MKSSTEEDVKNKIVLPFIKSLGFHESELHFEKSFHLTLGRYTYKINTQEQYQTAEGRLDILVRRNDNNLFIVEVKRDKKEIDDKDVEQATSYARLIHPIAPFAIVTNGKDFHIYDSVTREAIEKDNFPMKDDYEISISDEIRYEALKHFLGYSKENLLTFCREQVRERMRTLLGSKNEPTNKFIPELYSSRKELAEAFNSFLIDETYSVFAIIGDSGTGKTSSMCYTALELLKKRIPVLFYKGSHLIWSIEESIADDFNWIFTPQYSDIQIFKRIEELFKSDKLIIFVDAIDESNLQDRIEGNYP